MANVNVVVIAGRLGQKPDLRRTPSGTASCELSVAVDREWTDKGGERQKETTWVSVKCWDRTAENVCQYMDRGSSVLVEGYLKMDQWEDKQTGAKRSKLYVQAGRVAFLDGKSSGGGDGGGRGRGRDDDRGDDRGRGGQSRGRASMPPGGPDVGDEDDILF